MHEMNRHPVDCSEAAVDAPDELVHHRPQVLVLLDVLPRRDSDLDEDDFADPLGVLFEEDLHGVKLLRNALDVVEAVDTDNELDALETAAQGSDALLDLLLLERFVELARLDTDREGSDSRMPPNELDAIRRALEVQESRARRDKVAGVVVRVEADEVAVEDAEEDLAAHRQRTAIEYGQSRLSHTSALRAFIALTGRPPNLGKACEGRSRSARRRQSWTRGFR